MNRHHIIAHHRRRRPLHQCRRCKCEFDGQVALDEHLMVPKEHMCELNLAEPAIDC